MGVFTASGWLSGNCVRISCGRSCVRVPVWSYQNHHKMVHTASLLGTHSLGKEFDNVA